MKSTSPFENKRFSYPYNVSFDHFKKVRQEPVFEETTPIKIKTENSSPDQNFDRVVTMHTSP